MKSVASAISKLVMHLVDGWHERITWTDAAGITHTSTIFQKPLMDQLSSAIAQPRAVSNSDGGRSSNKAGSRAPGNFEAFFIRDDAVRVLDAATQDLRVLLKLDGSLIDQAFQAEIIDSDESKLILAGTLRELSRVVKMARVCLTYESPKSALADTQCEECDGTLVVAKDASSDVFCVGFEGTGGCGKRYRRTDWARLLQEKNALVDTASAIAYCGRPVGTLHRWASEGRIKQHGKVGHGQARWSLTELPQALPGEALPPPPPLPSAARTRVSQDKPPHKGAH